MGWTTAVVASLGAIQYKQQGAIGDFNQAVANRNALAMDQQKEAIEKKKEFDILQFDKEFKKIEGAQKVASAKAGVEFSGTSLRIQRANAEEAALEREIIRYNAAVQQYQAEEKKNAFIIQGAMAKEQSRLAQIQTITSTATSLLTMGGFGGSTQSYTQGAGSSKSLFTSNSAYR